MKTTRAVAAAAAVLFSLVFTTGAAQAPQSTPVPIETVDGQTMSYLVNATRTGTVAVARMTALIEDAGGAVVQSWPEIGVIVVHSAAADFRTALAASAGDELASVGATRTTSVAEATPAPIAVAAPRHGAWASANGDVAGAATPNPTPDALAGEQWDMTMIGADAAAAVSNGSSTVLVGVLDGGIDPDHPDLATQIDVATSVNCTAAGRPDTTPLAWASTTSDHGTHVAGTIAAARNGLGVTGVAPAVRLASVKVVNDSGFIYPEYAVCGFMWAASHGMDVTNNSYFVDPFLYYCTDQGDQAAALQAVRRAVAWSARLGVVNVAAAGNESADLATVSIDDISPNDSIPSTRSIDPTCVTIPAELDDVVTVGSLDPDGALSSFSNTGLGVIDVVAPGGQIVSSVDEENGWAAMSGTSMASPHAAGVAALIKSTHPDYSAAQVREALIAQARPMTCPASSAADGPRDCTSDGARTSLYGAGLVDALAAVTP